MDESLGTRVASLVARIRELRQAGDIPALLTAAQAAAAEIEQRVGELRGEPEQQALLAVKRFTYNAAADAWPGWSLADKPPEEQTLLAGLELARRSARLVKSLELGPLQEATGAWLCGAFELALGRYAEASQTFSTAREGYVRAKAPGLVLLTKGYSAIVRQVRDGETGADAGSLEAIAAQITAGGFEDGAEWIAQLRTALQVFTSYPGVTPA
jgi:hypothetical protein